MLHLIAGHGRVTVLPTFEFMSNGAIGDRLQSCAAGKNLGLHPWIPERGDMIGGGQHRRLLALRREIAGDLIGQLDQPFVRRHHSAATASIRRECFACAR